MAVKWHRGIVKFFSGSFGFVTPEGGGGDVFVHCTILPENGITLEDLKEGQPVEYTCEATKKGTRATALKLV